MKTFKTEEGRTITRFTHWHKIYTNPVNGRAFFIYNSSTYYLDTIEKLSYPIFFLDNGKLNYISGFIPITYELAFLVEIDDYYERVRLYIEGGENNEQ